MDLLLLLLCSVFSFFVLVSWVSGSRKLPPSPWGLPLIGHLHLLRGKLPHKAFHSISQKFGPIVHLRLGMVPAIVVSSPDLAREVLTPTEFSSRPYNVAGDYLEYGSLGVASSPYGEYYRGIRKLCATELFTTRCINSFGRIRKTEIPRLLDVVLECGRRNEAVDLRSCFSVFTFNVITQIVCTSTMTAIPIQMSRVQRVDGPNDRLGHERLFNFVPWYMRWLDWHIPRYKHLAAKVDKFLEKIVEEHKSTSRGCKDFVDMLLNHFGEGTQADIYVKATLKNMITGGTDTSIVTSEWLLAAIMHNPRVMKKTQEELDNVIGHSRMVNESDLPKLRRFSRSPCGDIPQQAFSSVVPQPTTCSRRSYLDCQLLGPVNGCHIVEKTRGIFA